MAYLVEYYQDILTILGALYTISTALLVILKIIAKLTPTTKDDELASKFAIYIEKAVSFFAKIGFDFTKKN